MNLNIRPHSQEDHPATLEIHNLNWPDETTTLQRRLEADAKRDPRYVFERYVVELDRRVVAYGTINHHEWMFHPQKFVVYIQVHPQLQNQGIGSRLYDFLLAKVALYNPNRLISSLREDKPAAVHFAQKRGFVETLRSWDSKLDIPSFDMQPYIGYLEPIEAQGYQIKSMAELGDGPLERRKMWITEGLLVQHIPQPEPQTWPSLQRYSEMVFQNSAYLPEATCFALAPDGEWVGMHELWSGHPEPELSIGMTGVLPAHRRRGLALALKLKGIEYAKAHSIQTMHTTNESNNQGILQLNQRFGFVRQPAQIDIAKDLL